MDDFTAEADHLATLKQQIDAAAAEAAAPDTSDFVVQMLGVIDDPFAI
ncbi:MAG: hypothetical protein AAF755_07090 [Pseudomonadota bacterium]